MSKLRSKKGQGLVEYAVLVALVVGIAIAAVNTQLRNAVTTLFTNTATAVSNAPGTSTSP